MTRPASMCSLLKVRKSLKFTVLPLSAQNITEIHTVATDLNTCDCAICSPPLVTVSAALEAVLPISSAISLLFFPSSVFSAS